MKHKIYVRAPKIEFILPVARQQCSCALGYQCTGPLCEYCSGVKLNAGVHYRFEEGTNRWVFNDSLFGIIDQEYADSIANLTSSLTLLSENKLIPDKNQEIKNTFNYVYGRTPLQIMDCFAPEEVVPLADAILKRDIDKVNEILRSDTPKEELIKIKNKSWYLENKNNVHFVINADSDAFAISPFLLAVLCKQPEIAMRLLKANNLDITKISFEGNNLFDILTTLQSDLISELSDTCGTYALQFCISYCKGGCIPAKVPLTVENMMSKAMIERQFTDSIKKHIDKLALSEAQALYVSKEFIDYICASRDTTLLEALYKKGVSPDHFVNDKQESLLFLALSPIKIFHVSTLLLLKANPLARNINGVCALDLLNEDILTDVMNNKECHQKLLPLIISNGYFAKLFSSSKRVQSYYEENKHVIFDKELLQLHEPKIYNRLFVMAVPEPSIALEDVKNKETPKPESKSFFKCKMQ